MAIPNLVAKKAIFIQEFRDIIETKNVASPVSTLIVSQAKYVESPFTSVGPAKAYTTQCVVPVATSSVSNEELVLDRKIGNAITDCREELSYANFDVIGMYRRDLYGTVMAKQNKLTVADFVASATVVAGTEDLSTEAKVRGFLIRVQANHEQIVSTRATIDGGKVTRAPFEGKAFVMAGTAAYTAIVSQVSSVLSQSSEKGIGDLVKEAYGVKIINLGNAAANANRLIYGTAGVPVIAYREDAIKVDMGEIVSEGTYTPTPSDIDLVTNDPLIRKTWYMSAETKGRSIIFEDLKTLVSTRLMA